MNTNEKIQRCLDNLPNSPGVYLMLNNHGTIIYVGKSKSLDKRVRSYFNRTITDKKTRCLIDSIDNIEIRQTATEVEAFLLENKLIKRYKPQYNVNLKDGRTYPYLAISKEDFPRVYVTRNYLPDEAIYFGPFVDVGCLYESINLLQEIFKFRTTKKDLTKKRYERPCLNYAINRCTAPCAGKVDKLQYAKQIKQLTLFLQGKKSNLIKQLKSDMEVCAQELKFELAAQYRDKIKALLSLNKGKKVIKRAQANNGDVSIDVQAGLYELQTLFCLDKLPNIIEGIDISNTSGRESVGSVVHFRKGYPYSSNYRHYKIKTVVGANDYASIYEIVLRKYGRIKREGGKFPDILLIDGGLGQLANAQFALNKIGSVPSFLISLAKREELIYTSGRQEPIRLPADSVALRILQSVRDEAHRFAQRYHKYLRDNKSLKIP